MNIVHYKYLLVVFIALIVSLEYRKYESDFNKGEWDQVES